jgi:glycine/D-amino acid oxidase-like deaminating enzyme
VIIDLDKSGSTSSELTPDVCVIRGGTVGITLATALDRAGADVLLLEGGGAGLEPDSQALQAGESIGQPFQNIDVGRYRVLGGTTLYWVGQLLPFDAFVTGPRPWAGHEA